MQPIMKKEVSILLPVYNNVCVSLVQQLLEQTMEFRDLKYEIIVADDGSDNAEFLKRNAEIATMKNCRYIVLEKNYGRAKVRNYMAQQAQYEWLLYLDSDVKLPNFFLKGYLMDTEEPVIYGGIRILGDQYLLEHNLKCSYEHNAQKQFLLENRQAEPYMSFRSTSFMVHKDVMEKVPFDERFTTYGYEDVLFGKSLAKNKIPILHINNPVHIDQFDNNSEYLAKIEEGLQTLKRFQNDLMGYSKVLNSVQKLRKLHLVWLIIAWHFLFKGMEKHNLTGKSPNLTLFKLYKLGYFVCL